MESEPAALVNAYFPSQAAAWEGKSLSAADFSPPEKCALCHRAISEGWQASAHAQAGSNPLYLGWLQAATVDTNGEIGPYCAGCHTPIGLLAGQVEVSRQWRGLVITPPDRLAASGVSCGFCHTLEGLNASGDAAYIAHPQRASLPQALEWLTPVQQTVFLAATGHTDAYSRDFYTTPEFCAVCHEATNPTSGLPVMTTYSEWRESVYNTGDPTTTVTCQDCHMPGEQRSVAGTPSGKGQQAAIADRSASQLSPLPAPRSPVSVRSAELPGVLEQPGLADHSLTAKLDEAVALEIAATCETTANAL